MIPSPHYDMECCHAKLIFPMALTSSPDTTAVLRQLMTAAEIPSFRQLCRVAGVSDWAVQQLRQGRIDAMRLATLQKLSQALGLSVAALLQNFGIVESEPPSGESDGAATRTQALEQEYQRLQDQMERQKAQLHQQFQQEVLAAIEPWLLQWPTVVHAVDKNPDLPASRLVPLVQPIQALLEQWNITAIAPVGSEVPYDPQTQQLMAGAASPGDLVRIRYAGFKQGETLLHRAKVSLVSAG